MTIPIQLPQIGATGVVRQPSILEQIAPVLESIAQQKLAQAQLENYRSLADERKQKAAIVAQDLQDQADAAKAFYQHISGAAVRLKPEPPSKEGVPSHQGVDESTGSLIPLPQYERGLRPGALVHYHQLLSDYNSIVKQRQDELASQAQTELHGLQASVLGDEQVRQQQTQAILQRYGPQLATSRGQRRALAEVAAAAGPDEANKLANAFNVGSGRYAHYAGPDGFLYIIDTKTGDVQQSKEVGTKVSNALTQDAIRRNAQTVADLLDEQHKIVQAGLAGSKNPTLAELAQTGRVLGISTEAVANVFRSDPQQLTQMLKTRFAHNYVGLLPHSRSAANLLTNLTESYWAPAGSSEATLRRADADREKLKAVLRGVASGTVTDLTRLPGYADALKAAAAEGQVLPGGAQPGVTTQPVNPDDWSQGVPPP